MIAPNRHASRGWMAVPCAIGFAAGGLVGIVSAKLPHPWGVIVWCSSLAAIAAVLNRLIKTLSARTAGWLGRKRRRQNGLADGGTDAPEQSVAEIIDDVLGPGAATDDREEIPANVDQPLAPTIPPALAERMGACRHSRCEDCTDEYGQLRPLYTCKFRLTAADVMAKAHGKAAPDGAVVVEPAMVCCQLMLGMPCAMETPYGEDATK